MVYQAHRATTTTRTQRCVTCTSHTQAVTHTPIHFSVVAFIFDYPSRTGLHEHACNHALPLQTHPHTFIAAVFVGMQHSRAHQLQAGLQGTSVAGHSSTDLWHHNIIRTQLGLHK